jgi:hypothetical protein
MVKNTTGGTKTKGLARKHQGGGGGGQLRIPQEDLEKVAYVSKMLGNGMCLVYINDKKDPLIAHIRKKFSGRHKRSNLISTGTCLLIGLRDWENPIKNCDVINVYEQHDLTTILNLPAIPTNVIAPMFYPDRAAANGDLHDHNILFDHDHDPDPDPDTPPTHTHTLPTISHDIHNHNHNDNDIDLQDI